MASVFNMKIHRYKILSRVYKNKCGEMMTAISIFVLAFVIKHNVTESKILHKTQYNMFIWCFLQSKQFLDYFICSFTISVIKLGKICDF